tara:strand:+ start:10 stop:177 length:168 start_codon:yes stop_codon:yes gene_type:complete
MVNSFPFFPGRVWLKNVAPLFWNRKINSKMINMGVKELSKTTAKQKSKTGLIIRL